MYWRDRKIEDPEISPYSTMYIHTEVVESQTFENINTFFIFSTFILQKKQVTCLRLNFD